MRRIYLDYNASTPIDPAAGAEALLKKLREAGIRTAVGSSSKNTTTILHAAGLEHHFDVCVDGLDTEALRLPGKPDPALFLEAARRLGVQPSRVILFEDALAGVEAGKRGGFECVVGIDHGQQRRALRQRGADSRHQQLGRSARRRKLASPLFDCGGAGSSMDQFARLVGKFRSGRVRRLGLVRDQLHIRPRKQ